MPVVIPEKNALVLHLRDPDKVTQILPHQIIDFEGARLVAVPHTIEAWRILRNLGINVVGFEPLRHKYKPPLVSGRYPAMAHQITSAAFLSSETRAYNLSTPRTGKTASALMAADFVRQQKLAKAILIVAPNFVLRSVWESEVFGMFPRWSVAVLQGDREKRRQLLAEDHDIYIINPDGLKVLQTELVAAVESGRIGIVIFDEVTDYANRGTGRWAAANAVKKAAAYCWALTGTPGDPDSVYGQVRLITPHTVPDSYTTWRDRTMFQMAKYKWVPKEGYKEHVKAALQPSIRFDKKDILDLPPLQFIEREATLSAEQLDAYEKMRKTFLLASKTQEITAANAAVMNAKLLQIATGAVKTDDGGVVEFDCAPRLEVLDHLIREADYKVVIFAAFKAQLRVLQRHISKTWSCEIVDGSVTGAKRDQVFLDFQSQDDPHILLAHPKTTAFGLEFGMADLIVFWGPPVNGPFVYQQAVERINSVKQKSKTPTIAHLHSSPVERALFRGIKNGVDINEGIVDLFRQVIAEAA